MREKLLRNIIVVYDIADTKRLSEVAKTVKDYGHRVQLSVFELFVDIVTLRDLHDKVNDIIDVREDSVRYYILCETDWQKRQYIGVKHYKNDPDSDKQFIII